jgi:thiol:disulfide interchange protein
MKMKRLPVACAVLIVFLMLVSCSSEPEGAGYDPSRDPAADLAAAVEEASASGRRIMLEVGGEWCHWCHLLEEFFDTHKEHRDLLHDNYVVVKVNYSPENENEAFLSRFPPFKGYPHIMILDSDGSHLHSQDTGLLEQGQGYDPEVMRAFLLKWAG